MLWTGEGEREGRGERKIEKSEVKRKLRGEIKETPTPCLSGRALGIHAVVLEPTGSQSVRHMLIPSNVNQDSQSLGRFKPPTNGSLSLPTLPMTLKI